MIECYEYLIPFGDNLGLKDAQIFYEHVTRPGWLELAHREHLFISWASRSIKKTIRGNPFNLRVSASPSSVESVKIRGFRVTIPPFILQTAIGTITPPVTYG